MSARSAAEVFEDHLRLRVAGELEEDLRRNYAEDVTLLCEFGALHGRDALRESAERLGLQLPDARFEFTAKHVDGEYALLVWRADSDKFSIQHGADSFVIRGGRIVLQTIYYALENK